MGPWSSPHTAESADSICRGGIVLYSVFGVINTQDPVSRQLP